MFARNPKTGKLFKESVEVLQDPTNPIYTEFLTWLQNGGTLENTDFETLDDKIIKGKMMIQEAYNYHREQGLKYTQEFEDHLATQVVIYKTLEEDKGKAIGAFLKAPILTIKIGQWKNALDELNALTISESYMQPYYQKIKDEVTQYIQENYNY